MRIPLFALVLMPLTLQAALKYDVSVSKAYRDIIEGDLRAFCDLDFETPFEGKEELEELITSVLKIDGVYCESIRNFLSENIDLITTDLSSRNIIFIDRTYGRELRSGRKYRGFRASGGNPVLDLVYNFTINPLGKDEFHDDIDSILTPFDANVAMAAGGNLSPAMDALLEHYGLADTYDIEFEYEQMTGGVRSPQKKERLPLGGRNRVFIVFPQRNFFLNPDNFPNQRDIHATSNSAMRIGTLIHEASHNDYLDHTVCTQGHFLGRNFCDDNPYGPYGAEIAFVLYFAGICHVCSDREREHLIAIGNRYAENMINSRSPLLDRPIRLGLSTQKRGSTRRPTSVPTSVNKSFCSSLSSPHRLQFSRQSPNHPSPVEPNSFRAWIKWILPQ